MTEDQARPPRPVTDEVRAQVAALHGEGFGRNEIARRVTVSAATVSKIAREAGLSFDREATAIALRARELDLGTIRETLARKFLLAANESLDLLDAPVTVGQFGGSDNVWNETLLDGPTIEQRKILIGSAQVAAAKGVELLQKDAEAGSAAATAMIVSLAKAIDAATSAGAFDGVDPTTVPDSREPRSEVSE